jgi:hypothetical protein
MPRGPEWISRRFFFGAMVIVVMVWDWWDLNPAIWEAIAATGWRLSGLSKANARRSKIQRGSQIGETLTN